MSELVKWSEKAEEPSEEGADEESSEKIPEEEFDDTGLAGVSFSPSNFRMEEIGENCSEKVGNHTVEPEKLVVSRNDAGKEGINCKVEEC